MIFTRYILKEMIVPFILGLFLIILIFVLNMVFQMLGKIAGRGLDMYIIMEFFFLNLAWIVTLAAPMAVLIATLMAFGRLSTDNEITALRASGISIFYMLRPALLFGLIMSLILFYFNDQILPDFNHRSRQLSSDITRKRPTVNMQEGVYMFDVPNVVLKARTIDGETSRLTDVVIYNEGDKKYLTTILADHGVLEFDYDHEKFIMKLYSGTIHRIERYEISNYEKTIFDTAIFRFDVPNMTLQRRDSEYRSDREMSSKDMMLKIQELRTDEKPNLRRINSYLVEINKKYSIPTACIVFTIVGVPLGIMFRSGGLAVSGGVSIFFFLIYWISLIGGEDLADRGIISPWFGMWFANILIALLGVAMIIRNLKGHSMRDLAMVKKLLPKRWRGENG